MIPDSQIACKVLDYWFSMEFLSQDSFELHTGCDTREKMLKNYLNDLRRGKQWQSVPAFFQISKEEIEDAVIRSANGVGMRAWGNLVFYVGKVKRQECIDTIQSELKSNDFKLVEKELDRLPVASFQCEPRGGYISGSFSLSPVAWAALKMCNTSGPLSDVISVDQYRAEIKELETTLFGQQRAQAPEEADIPEGAEPRFSAGAVDLEKIEQVRAMLAQKFSDCLEIDLSAYLSTTFYRTDENKEKFFTDDYKPLSWSFFTSDLQLARDQISRMPDNKSYTDLIQYICAQYKGIGDRNRHDLISPKDVDKFKGDILEILDVYHTPLGKWPSRYAPALMQQASINAVFAKKTRFGPLAERGSIFSVDGPPGTGKTTLLKEIIAGTVVEKARVLSQYNNPDSAFYFENLRHPFNDGEWSYSRWYSFKDKEVNQYGIIVASSNNTAVENITKELPLLDGVLNSLCENDTDSQEYKEQLSEIRTLFTPSSAGGACCQDPFLVKLASNLLGTRDGAGAWGMISAPLGKKENIKEFLKTVLRPLLYNLTDQNIPDHISRYRAARKRFVNQLEKVEALRWGLCKYSSQAIAAWVTPHQFVAITEKAMCKIREFQDNVDGLDEKIACTENAMDAGRAQISASQAESKAMAKQLTDLQSEQQKLVSQNAGYLAQAEAERNSISPVTEFFGKLFHTRKYEAAIRDIEQYEEAARDAVARAEQLKLEITRVSNELDECKASIDRAKTEVIDHQSSLEELKRSRDRELAKIRYQQEDIKKEEAKVADTINSLGSLLAEYRSRTGLDAGISIDDALLSDILSDDPEVAGRAQLMNPWTTQRYDFEREKLFAYALQMTQEFALSSKRVRNNLSLLIRYWGASNQMAKPHKDDCPALLPSLFQTLFLFMPVLSTTFSSFGNLFKDVQEPKSLGLLIVDEAGQAQPQMAVGALFRAKRAVIVGDPRQIEPIVKSDLELLRNTYTDDIYTNYKDKSASVQLCADLLNPLGTFQGGGTSASDWLGCPLVVHRRCISPMFEISNQISYSGLMCQQTRQPSQEKAETFLMPSSQWINIAGTEMGSSNHYVPAQGERVCKMVEQAFKRSDSPSLYIISPFSTVVSGVKTRLKTYAKRSPALAQKQAAINRWLEDNIGTVHKFQGKEANEVIFLLGCDIGQMQRYAVTGFVNSNMVNVAASRAKYRLYVIGDARVWSHNTYVSTMKGILDTYALKSIAELTKHELTDASKSELLKQAQALPKASSFVFDTDAKGMPRQDEESQGCEIYADDFISQLDVAGFLAQELTTAQLQEFGIESEAALLSLPTGVRKNLTTGIKLYNLLKPVYEIADNLDSSCCAVLFCKAAEGYIKANFIDGLRKQFPNARVRKSTMAKVDAKDLTLGSIHHVLNCNIAGLSKYMEDMGEPMYSAKWWQVFCEKLKKFTDKRNSCCHAQAFSWNDMKALMETGFEHTVKPSSTLGGVFYESVVGQKLNS